MLSSRRLNRYTFSKPTVYQSPSHCAEGATSRNSEGASIALESFDSLPILPFLMGRSLEGNLSDTLFDRWSLWAQHRSS